MNDGDADDIVPDKAEPVPARKLPGRYPLLWPLAALLAGYLATCAGLRILPLAACAVSAACGTVAMCVRRTPKIWGAFFLIGVTVAGAAWFSFRNPDLPGRDGFPTREAVLAVRIDELFAAKPGALSGIGRITAAPLHLSELEGVRIRFQSVPGEARAERDIGAVLTFRGRLESVPDEPGFSAYLRRRGVFFSLSRCRVAKTDVPASGFRILCGEARARVAVALTSGVGDIDAARLAALMLGRTSLLPKSEQEDFKKSGATHLFAISGLHITGMAAGVLWLTRRIRISDMVSVPAVLAVLWAYVMMAGAPPSAMRAWIMAAAMFGARPVVRGARPAGGLIAAALFTLAVDPSVMRDAGFLLSYVVVAAILFYAVPLAGMADSGWRPWKFIPPADLGFFRGRAVAAKRPVISAVTTTFSAGLSGTPLCAAIFGSFTPVGLLANLALVPVSGPPVLLCLISSACGVAGWPAGAVPFNRLAALFMRLLAWGAHLSASVPYGSMSVRIDTTWAPCFAALTVIAALLAAPVRPDRSRWRAAVLPVVIVADMLVLCAFG